MNQRLIQRTALFIAAAVTITASTWAQPPRRQGQRELRDRPTFDILLQRHDTNQDGKISKDEFRGPERFFLRLDADGDGVVDKIEFDGGRGAGGQRPGSGRASSDNNKTPMSSRMRRYEVFLTQKPAPGDMAPEFELRDLQGNLVSLKELRKTKPVLIETGSYTCPVFRGRHGSIEKLYDEFGDKMHLVVLYGREAHPGSNRFKEVEQPARNQQRVKLAQETTKELSIGVPVLVDDVDNKVTTGYGGLPNCGYLIGQDGRVFHKLSWIHPDLMKEPLQKLLKLGGSGGENPPHFPVGGSLPNRSGEPREVEPFASKLSVSKSDRSQRPRHRPRVLEGVETHVDLVYGNVDGSDLRLDLCLPEDHDVKPPLVMWIHGGGWKSGSKSRVNGAILRLAEHGYAVASIDYRLGDLQAHPHHIHDCKGALRWLKAHATDYGYDSERIAVGGGSAGGHLALLLGMSAGVDELEGDVGDNRDQSSRVQAIVDLYGPSELVELANSKSGFGRRHTFNQQILESASPLRYLTADDPPVLILQGSEDRLVLPSQSELLHKRYLEAGLDSTLHVIEGAGHGGGKFSDRERFELIREFLAQHLRR